MHVDEIHLVYSCGWGCVQSDADPITNRGLAALYVLGLLLDLV